MLCVWLPLPSPVVRCTGTPLLCSIVKMYIKENLHVVCIREKIERWVCDEITEFIKTHGLRALQAESLTTSPLQLAFTVEAS